MNKKFDCLEEGCQTIMVTEEDGVIKKEKVTIEHYNDKNGKVVYRKYNPDKYEEFSFNDGSVKVKNVFASQLLRNNRLKLVAVGLLYTALAFSGCDDVKTDADYYNVTAVEHEDLEARLSSIEERENDYASQNFKLEQVVSKANEYNEYLRTKGIDNFNHTDLVPLVVISNISNLNYDTIISMLDEGYLSNIASNQLLEDSDVVINQLNEYNMNLVELDGRVKYINNNVSFSNLIIKDEKAEKLVEHHNFLVSEYLFSDNIEKSGLLLDNNILIIEGEHPDLDLSEMNEGVNYLVRRASQTMNVKDVEHFDYKMESLNEILDDDSKLLDTLVYKIGLTKGGINLK